MLEIVMPDQREFDIIIYGASGFTGRLVAEYMKNKEDVTWAMAGRSEAKLKSVRDEIGISADVPVLIADSTDVDSLNAMAGRATTILTTTGPYTLYGTALVGACVEAGSHYVDLCGEPLWMREMINKYDAAAKASGARIVHSCGFDSIPFDLGVFGVQQEFAARYGRPATRVKGRVRAMQGTFSGGTAASFRATMAAVAKDPSLMDVMRDPFSLTPGFTGAMQPHGTKPVFDEDEDTWLAPFIMAAINTRNIHRSNFLSGLSYGEDFVYDEMVITGPGDQGEAAAKALASSDMMGKSDLKPGEGPGKDEREAGHYNLQFIASNRDQRLSFTVTGDKDPGYGSTSKMIAEAALCLAHDDLEVDGGIHTPASVMPTPLLARLQAHAGVTFSIDE